MYNPKPVPMSLELATAECKNGLYNRSMKIQQTERQLLARFIGRFLAETAVLACLLSIFAQSALAGDVSGNINSGARSTSPESNSSAANNSKVSEGNGSSNSLIAGGIVESSSFDAAQLDELKNSGLRIGKGTVSGFLVLEQGNALFCPTTDMVVRTTQTEIYLVKGSVSFVIATGTTTSIYNLFDLQIGDVTVVAGRDILKILPGKQFVLSRKSGSDFSVVNPEKSIATCDPTHSLLKNGTGLWKADFSISSAMTNVRPLKDLLSSTDARYQQLISQLLKTAADKPVTDCNTQSSKGGG